MTIGPDDGKALKNPTSRGSWSLGVVMGDVPWWLYLIECKGGKIYTGIAVDVEARFKKHCAGKGAAFTKANPPVRILAKVRYHCRRDAAQAEYAMKKLTATEKWAWVEEVNLADNEIR